MHHLFSEGARVDNGYCYYYRTSALVKIVLDSSGDKDHPE